MSGNYELIIEDYGTHGEAVGARNYFRTHGYQKARIKKRIKARRSKKPTRY